MNVPFWQLIKTNFKSDRYLVVIFAIGLTGAFLGLAIGSYLQGTAKTPAFGGSISIGMIGTPQFINPILAPANEVDRALVKLIFPSLLTHDSAGNLIPSLASSYSIEKGGSVYTLTLRENLTWEDGQPLDAHDVVFTVTTIQKPAISSPLFRLWEGVHVEAMDDRTVRFTLPEPYAFFLQNLTLGILPRHIWENVSDDNFALFEKNKEPVGAGPYQLIPPIEKSNGTIDRLRLSAYKGFWGTPPFIPSLTVRFYPTAQDLLEAFQRREITLLGIPFESFTPLLALEKNATLTSFPLPRYFAVFLNQKQNPALSEKTVREALLIGLNRDEIISSIFGGKAQRVSSPIPSVLTKYHTSNLPSYDYNPTRARELLEEAGFTQENPLKISFTVVRDDKLRRIAGSIAGYWEELGVEVSIILVDPDVEKLRDEVLRNRAYEAFLFGQALNLEPDLFSLWHSSQGSYPGLNIAFYANERVDQLLEELRQTFDEQERQALFGELQTIIMDDLPILLLYSPYQHVLADTSIQGINPHVLSYPEDYLNQVPQWYLFTKRVSR